MTSDKKRLVDLDRAHAWKPFTPMAPYLKEEPLILTAGDGAYVEDIDGNRYLDGVSSLWCNTHGHRHPAIHGAIRAQLDRVAHVTSLGPTHPGAIELAARLAAIAPKGLTRVFFSDAGATATEIALKIAFAYWRNRKDPRPGKRSFLTFDGAYHGDTIGAVSVGGIDLFHSIYKPLLFPTYRAPGPSCPRCPMGKGCPDCGLDPLDRAEAILTDHADEIAGVFLEPRVQGAAGMIVQPNRWIRRVRELCDRYEVLLIADEVATGFGRTGTMFACESEGVTPDLLCLGKGITGGTLPLAATLATERVFEAFLGDPSEGKTFFHGHTYTANPLGCAAALAVLDLFEKEKTIETNRPRIERLGEALAGLASHPHVGQVRRAGWMTGIELVAGRDPMTPYPAEARMGHRVCTEAVRRGLWIRPLGDVVVLVPPYCVTETEIDRMVAIVTASIDAATETAATSAANR